MALLLCLFTAFANEPEFYRIVNEQSYIELPCSDSNSTCSIDTECYLDVSNPIGETVIGNQNMTRVGNRFKYQHTFISTGEHKAYMYCQNSESFGDRSFSIFILEENYNYGNGGLLNSNILIGLEIFAIIMFAIFIFGNKNIIIGYSASVLNLLSALFIWTQGININITTFNIPLYYQVPITYTLPLGFLLVLFSVWLFWYSGNNESMDKKDNGLIEYRDEE